jgi:hypothetical protein
MLGLYSGTVIGTTVVEALTLVALRVVSPIFGWS